VEAVIPLLGVTARLQEDIAIVELGRLGLLAEEVETVLLVLMVQSPAGVLIA
jgi:hypothetical protein